MDEIRCTLSTTVLGCVDEFMGYIADYYHLNGFVSDSISRLQYFWHRKSLF